MGTPGFAVPVLQALLDAGHEVAAVYTQPPRPAGRGHRIQKSAVHELAEARGLPVRTPHTLKDPGEQEFFRTLNLDAAVVVAYGLILPRAILDTPRLGCINIHASLLPRWRGAAPIQRATMAGDTETGITVMQMDPGLDTGPMLMARSIPITDKTTAPALHDALSSLGAQMIVPALEGLAAGTLKAVPQPAEGVTHAAKLEKEEGRLDWTKDALVLGRQVRALNPWPSTWFMMGDEPVRVLEAEPVSGPPPAPPGTLVGPDLTIACSTGALRLLKVQRPGRKPVDGPAFLNGCHLKTGDRIRN